MFLTNKPKTKLVAIIDIQSSVVRATLICTTKHNKPFILSSYSVPIKRDPQGDSSDLIESTSRSIDRTINAISVMLSSKTWPRELPNKLHAVHYVLLSPWIVSQTKSISYSFEKRKVVTEKEIQEILTQERDKMSQRDRNDLDVIEEKVFEVRLNGYPVSEWRNRETERLEILYIVSITSHRIIERFKKLCLSIAKERTINFHSGLFLHYLSMRSILPKLENYALIHIHKGSTDVIFVRRQMCVFFGSYPIGTQSLVGYVSEKMQMTEKMAESFINIHTSGAIDHSQDRVLDETITKGMESWIERFKSLVTENNIYHSIPSEIFISSREYGDIFTQTLVSSFPNVKTNLLSIEQLADHVDYDPRIEKSNTISHYALAIHSLEDGDKV